MKDKNYECWPVKKWHTNSILKGFDDVADLPITISSEYNQILSVWKVKSLWGRIKFLFTGEVSFTC